jgi:hypothetical protein
MKCAEEFLAGLREDGWDVECLFLDLSSIAHNRDALAQQFAQNEKYKRFPYALWMDDDMAVPGLDINGQRMREPSEAMERLIRGIEKRGVGISATVAVCRRFPFRLSPQLQAGRDVLPDELVKQSTRGGFSKAARVGMAFTLVKREVYEALAYPWYRVRIADLAPWREIAGKVVEGEKIEEKELAAVERAHDEATSLGEDYLFCDRAAQAGFAVEIDWGTWTGHEFYRVAYPSLYVDSMRRRYEAAKEAADKKLVVAAR